LVDWPVEQTEAAQSGEDASKHLWEESWDDDDTNDDFSAQLKYVDLPPLNHC
jgi:26 proteasome complex subunit DSS1